MPSEQFFIYTKTVVSDVSGEDNSITLTLRYARRIVKVVVPENLVLAKSVVSKCSIASPAELNG